MTDDEMQALRTEVHVAAALTYLAREIGRAIREALTQKPELADALNPDVRLIDDIVIAVQRTLVATLDEKGIRIPPALIMA